MAVVLYVWRSLDARLDRQDQRHQADLASLRTDLANVDRRLARIEGLLEGARVMGPWPARPEVAHAEAPEESAQPPPATG